MSENPKCSRCGEEKPVFTVIPNAGKYPKKRDIICEDCQTDDDTPIPESIPETTKVGGGNVVVQDAKFEPEPPVKGTSIEDMKTSGPAIDREDIAKKIKWQEETIVKATEELRTLEQKAGSLRQMILAKQGCVSGWKNLLE